MDGDPTGSPHPSPGFLRWVTSTLAVVGPDPGGTVTAAATQMPSEPGVATVVGQITEPGDWAAVLDALPVAVQPGTAARLAVSDAGTALPAGSPAPAEVLARHLEADVVAPAGPVLLVPDGTLFAVDGWRRFGGDGSSTPAGRRHPRPPWEDEIDTVARHTDGGLHAQSVPAGLWLHGPTRVAPAFHDPVFAVPADVDRPVVVLGWPGLPVPDSRAVLTVLDALDPSVVLAPYGVPLDMAIGLAAEVAQRWGRPVEVTTGLPALDEGHRLVSVAVDSDGGGWWLPPVPRLRCRPGLPPEPSAPPTLFAGFSPAGDGHEVGDGWVVEATSWGLWVRPAGVGDRGDEIRGRPGDAARLTVLAGLPGTPLPPGAGPAVARVVARLTRQQFARTRFLPEQLHTLLHPAPEAAGRS